MGKHDEDAEVDCDEDVCAPAPQTIPGHSVIIHEKYNPKEAVNDIVILKLKSSVKFNGKYQVISYLDVLLSLMTLMIAN